MIQSYNKPLLNVVYTAEVFWLLSDYKRKMTNVNYNFKSCNFSTFISSTHLKNKITYKKVVFETKIYKN